MAKVSRQKKISDIASEWDRIAATREDQIASGKDHSANHVLAPAILHELCSTDSLIDIGCGTGWLTSKAAKFSKRVIGIDPSAESIAISEISHARENITYHAKSIEDYILQAPEIFSVAISNMAASSAPNLESFICSSRRILAENGTFILTIPHPCFWPNYWGYDSDPKFDYQKTCAIESNFKIRQEECSHLTTHFHHPLELYINTLIKGNFLIEKIRELAGRGYNHPRFILIRCRAT